MNKAKFPHQTLTWEKVREIRSESAAGMPNPKLAEKYGVCRPQISKIVNLRCWVERTRRNSRHP
jgi:hypothetical protein